jgi:hypothetical protein
VYVSGNKSYTDIWLAKNQNLLLPSLILILHFSQSVSQSSISKREKKVSGVVCGVRGYARARAAVVQCTVGVGSMLCSAVDYAVR